MSTDDAAKPEDLPGGEDAARLTKRKRDYSGRKRTPEENARDYARQKERRQQRYAERRAELGLPPDRRAVTEEHREKLRQNMAKARAAQTVGPAAQQRLLAEQRAAAAARDVVETRATSGAPAAIGGGKPVVPGVERAAPDASPLAALPPDLTAQLPPDVVAAVVRGAATAAPSVPALPPRVPAEPIGERPGAWRRDPRSKWPKWQQMVAFIHTMKVPDGPMAGQNIELMDWQIEMIRAVYEPHTINSAGKHVREVQKAVWSMGRKAGKTSLAACLLMCHLIGPVAAWGGQAYSVAYERNQAAIVFRAVASIIRQDLLFPHMFAITDSAKKVYTPWTNSTYQALSAESRSKHGLNPNFVIFDELAQFGSDRTLYDVMETSFGAQDEPLMLTISTQADRDDAVLSELIDYGLQVQAGEIHDPTFHLTFHHLPDGLDPWDEKNWHYANPGLGVFRSLDEMRNYARKARATPGAEGTFLNLYHNRRISQTQTAISREVWEENAEYYAPEALAGLRCWGGLDLSSRTDLTAFVLVFETDGEDGPLAVLPFFWTPRDTLAGRSEKDKVPYDLWTKQGYIEAPEGTAIDYGYVAKRLAQLHTTFEISLTGFDRWRMDVLQGWMKEVGLEMPLEPMGQGFKDASLQIESLEEVLLNRRLAHGGHPVLRYCALGAKITKDPAGGRKFDKSKSNSRIDGLVALAMALRARDVWYSRTRKDVEGEKRRSGYLKPETRERGLIVL